jgi:hypothetical protein
MPIKKKYIPSIITSALVPKNNMNEEAFMKVFLKSNSNSLTDK